MGVLDKIQVGLAQQIERLNDYLANLNARERVMVIFCVVFVGCAGIGSALWYTHQAAEQQQKRADDLKDLLIWMQSHAGSMKPNADLSMTTLDKVKRVAQQQSLSLSVAEVSNQIQLQTQHPQYNVLANFLTQIAQMGVSIEKMQLSMENDQIKLTATVQ